MKTFTIEDIRSWKPCYDPNMHLPEGWTGTVNDILDNTKISVEDRFWVVLRTDLVSERTMRLFAVWCARQVQHLVLETERKSFNDILDVCHRYAMGEATDQERDAAWGAARDAARGAARGAARDAAWGAAWDAARGAARGAAWDAARDAARGAARGAARDAAQQTQLNKLKEMIADENKETS